MAADTAIERSGYSDSSIDAPRESAQPEAPSVLRATAPAGLDAVCAVYLALRGKRADRAGAAIALRADHSRNAAARTASVPSDAAPQSTAAQARIVGASSSETAGSSVI
jgi:hypothetical protein